MATPSSKRRVDGVEIDATIQHERRVKTLIYAQLGAAAGGLLGDEADELGEALL